MDYYLVENSTAYKETDAYKVLKDQSIFKRSIKFDQFYENFMVIGKNTMFLVRKTNNVLNTYHSKKFGNIDHVIHNMREGLVIIGIVMNTDIKVFYDSMTDDERKETKDSIIRKNKIKKIMNNINGI